MSESMLWLVIEGVVILLFAGPLHPAFAGFLLARAVPVLVSIMVSVVMRI